jgi:mono/diheme cytochrome c family protein
MELKTMQTKAIFISLLTLGLTILIILPVAAGGWATITLDEIPENVHAGERITIGFTVRQHGINPMADLSPKIVALHTETKETISVDAVSQGDVGHYWVKLNFPQAGTWNWIIQAFTMEQSMPPLVVLPALADGSTSRLSLSPQIWITGLGIVTALVALVLFISNRSSRATLLLVAALLIIGVGFSQTTIQPSKPVAEAAPQLDPIEQGEALFLAKGCITCHPHTSLSSKYKVVNGISGPAGSAPDLTTYAADPTYLRAWLSDPAAVKLDTTMPNPDLSSEEIEALNAFLVNEPSSSKKTAGGTSKQDCR